MLKLGTLEFNGTPRIAVAISDKESNEELKGLPIDALEVRADRFDQLDIDYVCEMISQRKALEIPLLLTVRNDPGEGGTIAIPEQDKLAIFKAAIPLVDGVDIELSSPAIDHVVSLAKKNEKLVIVSAHKLKSTPAKEDLKAILSNGKAQGADIVKIAAKANSNEDVETMLTFTQDHREDNIITMSLGALGSVSRVSFPFAGSLLTYSFIDQPFAEGQIAFNDLREAIRRYSQEHSE